MSEKNEARDLLGLAPYGEAINTLVKGGVDGAGAFLSRILLPPAGEIGFYLEDIVKRRRLVAEKASHMTQGYEIGTNQVPLRLVAKILDEAGLEENEELHTMWAALLANAAINPHSIQPAFIEILRQLTLHEAWFLDEIAIAFREKEKKDRETPEDTYPRFTDNIAGGMLGIDHHARRLFNAALARHGITGVADNSYNLTFDNLSRLRVIKTMLDVGQVPERFGGQIHSATYYKITHLGGSFIEGCQPPKAVSNS